MMTCRCSSPGAAAAAPDAAAAAAGGRRRRTADTEAVRLFAAESSYSAGREPEEPYVLAGGWAAAAPSSKGDESHA